MTSSAGFLLRARETRRYLFLRGREGEWNVPGGWREPGEEPEQCALRELVEETGFYGTIRVSTRVVQIDEFWLYAAECEGEFAVELSEEHVEYRWARLRDMPSPHHAGLDYVVVDAEA
jgi:8-oxo-dGTP diphosphatase